MGQAKQRKDAGCYPVQDGSQPTKAKNAATPANPSCPLCHGTGIRMYRESAGQMVKVGCGRCVRHFEKRSGVK